MEEEEYFSLCDFSRFSDPAKPRAEVSSFVETLSKNFAEVQIAAIKAAEKGHTFMLNAVREMRKLVNVKAPEGVETRDVLLQGTPSKMRMRLYIPQSPPNGGKFKTLLYIHGGGWTIGSIEGCSKFCSRLALAANAVVAAPDYRLAPENPYPAPNDDCVSAYLWLLQNASSYGGESSKIFAGGDSAGGHLAISLFLRLQDAKVRPLPAGLLLTYPATTCVSVETPSWTNYAKGYCLDSDLMDVFISCYIPDVKQRLEKYASPLLSKDFKDFPPTLILASECDILRDQAYEFAAKLVASGVNTRFHPIMGGAHMYITMPNMDTCFNEALHEYEVFLRKI